MTDAERRERLAWYVNGSLPQGERAELERAIAEDSGDLAREVAELRVLRAAIAEEGEEEPAFPPTLIHDAWRQIRAHEQEQAARAEARPAARLARFFDAHIASLWRNATGVGRLALAAQLALVVALGAATLRTPPPAESEYGSLSGPQDPVPGIGSLPMPDLSGGSGLTGGSPRPPEPLRVLVMFKPEATQQSIAALLRRLDAQIVGGPSNQQLYELEVAGPADPTARAPALGALVRSLASERELVMGAAPEGR